MGNKRHRVRLVACSSAVAHSVRLTSHHSPACFEQPSGTHGRLRGHRWQLAAHVALHRRARVLEDRASPAVALARESAARRPTTASSHRRDSNTPTPCRRNGHTTVRKNATLTSLSLERCLDTSRVSSSTRRLGPRTRLACWPFAGVGRKRWAWRLAYHTPPES